jgi:hypothetical protein
MELKLSNLLNCNPWLTHIFSFNILQPSFKLGFNKIVYFYGKGD